MGNGRIRKWRDRYPPHLRSLPTLQPCLRLCLWMWFSECGSVRRRRTVSLDVCVGVYYWCWLILLHRQECCFWLLSVRSASFRFVPRWLWLQSFVHVPTFVRCPLILSCFLLDNFCWVRPLRARACVALFNSVFWTSDCCIGVVVLESCDYLCGIFVSNRLRIQPYLALFWLRSYLIRGIWASTNCTKSSPAWIYGCAWLISDDWDMLDRWCVAYTIYLSG